MVDLRMKNLRYCFLIFTSSFLFVIFSGIEMLAQPFTKKYILSFHTCDASCMSFQDHLVHLAESDDGINWSLVPNFIPYSGSVPDVIVRGNKLYIYTPSGVKRYDKNTNVWDTNPVNVSIVDLAGNPVTFVDPSAIIDSSGNIVLFFLNSTGSIGDPAGCNPYPCTKYFDSAIEVNGSDGTQFVMQGGHRASITLNNSPQTASDPDIYFDGQDYILYISQGPSTLAYWGSTMHGSYQTFIIFPNNVLTNSGGIPCGYYNSVSSKYWTYIHANVSGSTVIQYQSHNDFSSALANFTTVISGPVIGEPSSTKTESPGFCTNDFLNRVNEYDVSNSIFVFPNPSLDGKFNVQSASLKIESAEVLDVLGRQIQIFNSERGILNITKERKGIYFLKITDGKNRIAVKKLVIE